MGRNELDFVRTFENSDLTFGNETGVKSFICSYDVREVQVTLLTLYCEYFVSLFVDLNDKETRIKLIDNDFINEKLVIWVFWNMLV